MSETKNIIGVYAICKNERKFLNSWLLNMVSADYIAVLDTGSTEDDTYEALLDKQDLINKDYGYEKLIVNQETIIPWRFDVARNIALDMLPEECNVYVSVDLDELFEVGWVDILREKWVDGEHERANYLYTWSHTESGGSGRVFRYNKIHSKNWRWRYPVHESLYHVETNSDFYDWRQSCDLTKEIMLHHFPDKTKSRSNYLPLLEQRAEEYPEDYYGLIYLAHEYCYRAKYQKSIDLLNRILNDYKERLTSLEVASCYLFMGDSYKSLENYNEAEICYIKSIQIEPTYREGYLAYVKLMLEEDRYGLAIEYGKMALCKTYRHYTWLERDNSWGYEPYDLLSLAMFYSGDRLKSLAYAYKAWSLDKSNKRLENNINLIINNMEIYDWVEDRKFMTTIDERMKILSIE